MFSQENSLVCADCLDYLQGCIKEGKTNFIDLVYIDPPFNSNRDYNILFEYDSKVAEEAFKDTWSTISYLDELEKIKEINFELFNFLKLLENTGIPKSYINYLTMMGIRCYLIRELLKDTGSFYYHCDPTMSHYVKIMLDYIFGVNNFRNEIIWKTDGSNWGKSSETIHKFTYNHQSILRYSKTSDYIFNKLFFDLEEEEIKKRFPLDDNDGNGPYAWSMLYKYDEEDLKNKIQQGICKWPRGNKFPRYKQYLKDSKGNPVQDIWTDISSITRIMRESEDYPTQKPKKLMERIILSSSNEGDLVADFFMGGGTTCVAALKNNRNFIGVDLNFRAIQITKERIEREKKILRDDFYIFGIPRSSQDLRELVNENIIGKSINSKFELEEVIIKFYLENVKGNDKKVGDNSIDGYFHFNFDGKDRVGLVQVTSSGSIGHLKAFCSEIGKGTGEVGVYITFQDKVTDGMIRECKGYGKIAGVDKIQILTIEDLVDNRKQFEVPRDILTI